LSSALLAGILPTPGSSLSTAQETSAAEGGTVNQSRVIVSEQILHRVCGEYLEMPGLQLTRPQAQRLWGLDEQTCAVLLESLTEEKFLYRRPDGMYARLTDGAVTFPPLRMVKVDRAPRLAGGTESSTGERLKARV
jgi:hypothetical protein